MWGRSTKQRRAAQKRRRYYARRRRWEMKNLAFGFLYSNIPESRYPDFIKKWLKSEERLKYTTHLRHLVHDYSAIELRALAGTAQALNYPIVTAVQNDEYTVTRRRRT